MPALPPEASSETSSWADADLVPLSALQHYAYCPRQCALIHVEQAWSENLYTLRGTRAHERVDEVTSETRDGVRTERALPLFSDRHGLVGRADVVEFAPGGAPSGKAPSGKAASGKAASGKAASGAAASGVPYPVEHKVGPRKARRADEIQLCAQAICLEEMFGHPVPEGALYHAKSRRRRTVAFTPELRAETLATAEAVRAQLRQRRLPPPVNDARCPRCSLVETCMPGVVSRLADESAVPDDAPSDDASSGQRPQASRSETNSELGAARPTKLTRNPEPQGQRRSLKNRQRP